MRVGGYIAGALVGAGAAALLFRHLGVVETGRYVTAMSLVAIVAGLSDLGLSAVGVREISLRPASERWRLAQELLGLRIVLTVSGVAAMSVIAWVGYSATLAAGVALAGVGLLLQATQDNFAMPLTVDLRLGWVSALDLLRQVLNTLLILLLVVAGAHLLAFLSVSIPAGLVVLVSTVIVVRGRRALRPSFDRRQWRALLTAMLPYSAAVAAAAIYFRVSIVIVSALSSSTQLGYFSASFRIVEALTAVPALLASAAFPIFARAARDDHERFGYALGRVFEVALIVGVWLAVSIAVGATLAINIIGGSKFHPASQVLAIQGVAIGAMFVSAVWANGLLGLGLYKQILALNLAALAANAVLVSLLVSLDGARGAAIGTGLAEIGYAIGNALLVVRGRPLLSPSLRILPKVALAAALGLAPMAMAGVPVIVRLLISTTLFACTLAFTRALPPELTALLPKSVFGSRSSGV